MRHMQRSVQSRKRSSRIFFFFFFLESWKVSRRITKKERKKTKEEWKRGESMFGLDKYFSHLNNSGVSTGVSTHSLFLGDAIAVTNFRTRNETESATLRVDSSELTRCREDASRDFDYVKLYVRWVEFQPIAGNQTTVAILIGDERNQTRVVSHGMLFRYFRGVENFFNSSIYVTFYSHRVVQGVIMKLIGNWALLYGGALSLWIFQNANVIEFLLF